MSHPTLLLADDHRDTGNLLRGLLQDEFDVLAVVEDGIALVNAAERLSPRSCTGTPSPGSSW